jgi:carbonic anhydrase
MDLGIGDIFNCRVAGNVRNADILGSMEFACKLAGAKVLLVMGHTACGAIKGAIDNAELGNLTGLLGKIKPAIDATAYAGERSAKNYAFVDAVARKKLEKVILTSSARKTKGANKRAATIADMLCACGLTWKHSLTSRQEFLEKMRDAIRLCCQDL